MQGNHIQSTALNKPSSGQCWYCSYGSVQIQWERFIEKERFCQLHYGTQVWLEEDIQNAETKILNNNICSFGK